MIQAEKNMKRRSSYLPISMGRFLKIAVAVAGFAIWGWAFVAVVAGIKIGFAVLLGVIRGVLSLVICLISIFVLIAFIMLLVALIF